MVATRTTKKKTTKKKGSATAADQTIAGLREEIATILTENERLRVVNRILLEGCAIIREEAINRAQSVGYATRLTETIFKVMRSDEAMEAEVDRRLADPRRSWWSEKDKEMFPEPNARSQSGG